MSGTQRRPAAARQARPAQRYFPGKALPGAASVHSDSEDSDGDDEAQQQASQEPDVSLIGDIGAGDIGEGGDEAERNDSGTRSHAAPARGMNVALRNVNIQDGKVLVDGRVEVGRTEMEESSEEEDEDEAISGPPGLAPAGPQEDEESDEDDSSSEEEVDKPAFMVRPVFVPKRNRVTVLEREAEAQNTEESLAKREEEAEKRRKESHDLVAENIKRELAEKEIQEVIPDVDDTDGLDPTTEFEDWRLRELSRIKRDSEAQLAREEERAEVERRRALPEQQRLAEDLEHAKKTREEKPQGKQKFLQKYYHKGAFRQDDVLLKRDYTEATESTIDVSLLPKVMQVKNFGKRSQTKYTHLLDQDTTRNVGGFGGLDPKAGPKKEFGEGCFNCGGPHLAKECTVAARPGQSSFSGPGTGANQGYAPTRQWGVRSWGPSSEREDGGYRRPADIDDRDRNRDRRPRSLSRSPPPRRRSRSPPAGKHSRSPPPRKRNDWDKNAHRSRRDDYGGSRRQRSRSREHSPGPYDSKRRRRD